MSEKRDRSAFGENVLLQEYLRLCTDIRSIESGGDRVIGMAVTLLGLGATIGIAQKIDALFIVLPIAIIGVMAYGITAYVWIFSMGGYKSHLEDLINGLAAKDILLWEKLVPKREKYNLARNILMSVYILVSAGVMSLSVIRVSEAYGLWWGRGIAALGVVGLILLLMSWRKMRQVGPATYQNAKSLAGADAS